MAVKIRLRQQGCNNRQHFRVVVADGRSPRDGKYLEMLGWYHPMQKENNVLIDAERLKAWIDLGAEPSSMVESLMGKVAPDVFQALQERRVAKRKKVAAARRKARKAV